MLDTIALSLLLNRNVDDYYSNQDLETLEDRIRKCLTIKETDLHPRKGLCSSVFNPIPGIVLMSTFFKWRGFSGNTAYPIKGGPIAYSLARQTSSMLKGSYGRSRKRLFKHVQKELAKLLID